MVTLPGHFGYTKARDLLDACKRFNERYDKNHDADDLMAAVHFATHVVDWLFLCDLGFVDKNKALDQFKNNFAAKIPEWDILHQITNGTKHPKSGKIQQVDKREAEWEDSDWWSVGGGWHETLFIDVAGNQRALYSVIEDFCRKCNAHLASLGK